MLNLVPGDDIRAALALYGESRTLLVTTLNRLYVFRDVDILAGDIPATTPLENDRLVTCGTGTGVATVKVGSPLGLAYDPATNEIVAYTNFRVVPVPDSPTFGFLGAFALPAEGPVIPRSLWCRPLAITEEGNPEPGLGTAGQPALFRYGSNGSQATGLIVNTVATGTYIFK